MAPMLTMTMMQMLRKKHGDAVVVLRPMLTMTSSDEQDADA